MANPSDLDEWEVCNNNGFVCKRRRPFGPTTDEHSAFAAFAAAAAAAEADMRRRHRDRKKKSLLSLREKYSRELNRWQTISSSSSSSFAATVAGPTFSSVDPPPLLLSTTSKLELINELLLQAEAQETILRKLSELCHYVDSVCQAEEERFAEALVDLPIWGCPKSLVARLQSL